MGKSCDPWAYLWCSICLALDRTSRTTSWSPAACGSSLSHFLPATTRARQPSSGKSDARLEAPNMQIAQIELPFASRHLARFDPPANAWGILPGIARPKSRGRLRLTGPNPSDPIEIEANTLAHPADLEAVKHCVELCREIGNSAAVGIELKRRINPMQKSPITNIGRPSLQCRFQFSRTPLRSSVALRRRRCPTRTPQGSQGDWHPLRLG
jgi:hypothetical protein